MSHSLSRCEGQGTGMGGGGGGEVMNMAPFMRLGYLTDMFRCDSALLLHWTRVL